MRPALFAACALIAHVPDAPQVPPPTAVMLVLGWDVGSRAIIYVDVLPFADTWDCEEARSDDTPESDNKVRFTSECVAPTDVGI